VPELRAAPYIANEADLAAVMSHIRHKVYAPLKLHEYHLADVNKVIAEFAAVLN
jgi:hypothetical protein